MVALVVGAVLVADVAVLMALADASVWFHPLSKANSKDDRQTDGNWKPKDK